MGNSTTNGTNGHSTAPVVFTQPSRGFLAVEAEMCLLGSMLISKEARVYAARHVQRQSIQTEGHVAIYDTIIQQEAAGVAVGAATVATALMLAGTISDAKGLAYMHALIDACDNPDNARIYASQVMEAWTQKQAWNSTNAALDALHNRDFPAFNHAVEQMQAASTWGSGTRTRFALKTSAEVQAMEPKEQLIDGILPVDALVCVFGASATYKSFLVLDMAAHVSNGLDWHGRATLSGPVVYVAGEGASGLGKRHRAWCTHRNQPDLPNLYTITDAPNMTRDEDAAELARAILELPTLPRLIVLDTMHVCMEGADENSARDMSLFIGNCKRLKVATGATVLFVHHTGNNERVRGSSSIKADIENMIEVRAQDDKVTLFAEKVKDGPKFEPLTFQRVLVGEYPTGSLAFDPINAQPCGKALPQAHETARAVLENQFPDGATLQEWEEACKASGVSRATFYRARRQLDDTATIQKIWGKWFVVGDHNKSHSLMLPNGETETETKPEQ